MNTNLGLDQDLINSVKNIVEACGTKEMEKEELHPNQKVLDKNKNGKLDADDFKKLRKEEAEELDELSKSTLGSYAKKASDESGRTRVLAHAFWDKAASEKSEKESDRLNNIGDDSYKHHQKRQAGASKAIDKLTKEQVEEIEALAAKHGLGE